MQNRLCYARQPGVVIVRHCQINSGQIRLSVILITWMSQAAVSLDLLRYELLRNSARQWQNESGLEFLLYYSNTPLPPLKLQTFFATMVSHMSCENGAAEGWLFFFPLTSFLASLINRIWKFFNILPYSCVNGTEQAVICWICKNMS